MAEISALLFVLLLLAAIVLVAALLMRKKHPARGAVVQVPAVNKSPAREPDSAPAIFICYRRDDASDVTGRIYDRLVQHFGRHSVFKDVDNIPLGVDFREHLGDAVGRCDVVLAVIGRQWLIRDGVRRHLEDMRDFVRLELEAALERNIPVVPVLVQGASAPQPEDLPQPLRPLVYRNGIPVRADPDFHPDMDKLIKGIEGYLKRKAMKS